LKVEFQLIFTYMYGDMNEKIPVKFRSSKLHVLTVHMSKIKP
jgi:hypothetical protein